MSINYYLLKNANTTNGVSYRPIAQATADAAPADFAAQIAARTGQKPEEVLKTLLAVGPTLGAIIASGAELDWPEFALFKPNITAASVPTTSSPLPTTARADVQFNARGGFKTAFEGATFTRIEAPSRAPQWDTVSAPFGDLAALSGGEILQIRGANLDFNNVPPTREEGIFLRLTSGGAPIAAPNVSVHTPQKIDFQLPIGLAAGAYNLELHTRGEKAAESGPLETFIWPGVLTVV